MINIDIELYKIFYTVASCENITKAAEKLYISQPAVTMSIKKLETELEIKLFVRNKRGVTLTPEGKVLYEYVSKAMENIFLAENKIENFKKLETGNIRIGIGTNLTKFFLVKYLEKFHKIYPKITINLDTSMTKELLKKLEEDKIDIAIIASDDETCKEFNVEYVEEIQDIFVASDEFCELKDRIVTLEELSTFPLLLQSSHSNTRKFIDKIAEKNGIKLSSIMDLASYSLVIEFAKIGMGVGLVTKSYVQEELNNKSLFEINVSPKIPKRKILVLTKKNYLPSFSTSKLIDIICGKI